MGAHVERMGVGVSRASTPYKWWVSLLLVGVILGVYGVITSLTSSHEEVLGGTRWIPWGVLVSNYVFLALIATGICFTTSLGSVFGIKKYNLLARRGAILALISLVTGGISILLELERPWRLAYLFFLSPNFTSLIWWMGFWYALYGLFLILEVWALNKADVRPVRFVSTMVFLVAIGAHSSLGAAFGLIETRELWYGAYTAIFFTLTAFLSGAAVLSTVTTGYHMATKKEIDQELVIDMSRLMVFLLGAYLFFLAWKLITSVYGEPHGVYEAISLLLTGPYSLNFWGIEVLIGAIIPFFVLLFPKNRNATGLLVTSILVNIGIFFVRYDWVVAGQGVPLLKGHPQPAYSPSFIEGLIVLFTISLFALLYTLGERYLSLEKGELTSWG